MGYPHFNIIFTIILFCTISFIYINAQRDLVAISQKKQYALSVIGNNGKQLIMGGIDPRHNRPIHPAMCYTTPWNKQGADVALQAIDRLHYIAPAWFQLHLDIQPNPQTHKQSLSVRITGHQDINKEFLQSVWRRYLDRNYTPKVTPRVSLQITKQSIQLLLNPKTHVSIIEALLELVHNGGLPRIQTYKGFDGIVLEMPAVWNHLPPYPNSIVSYIPSENIQLNKKTTTPIDPNESINLDAANQRANDYGTYHYDFTDEKLQKHPRHIINMFIRKLGTALQAGDKSLLIVTSPYQFQQDPTQHFNPQAGISQSTTTHTSPFDAELNEYKKYDSLDCKRPQDITLPQAFTHIDAYYLAPYIDYANVMTYDFNPQNLNDIHHIRDIEKQSRTVATTRIGYNSKRLWRIFIGKSSIDEGMFLEDYIRLVEEINEENAPETTNMNSEQLVEYKNKRELQIKEQLQKDIDEKVNKYQEDVNKNILKRLRPRRDYMMCFNIYLPHIYQDFNPISAQCAYEENPLGWWHTVNEYYSRNRFRFGINNDMPEQDSEEGSNKKFVGDTWKEMTDGIEIHKMKLRRDFSLKRDDPWPHVSYGWSVSPIPWVRNSILALNIPFMCLEKITSHWDQNNVSTIPIKRIVDLKQTLPKTSINRDLVIPIKLDKIAIKFEFDNDFVTNLRNDTVSELCYERNELINQYKNTNRENDIPIDESLDEACRKQRELVELEQESKLRKDNPQYKIINDKKLPNDENDNNSKNNNTTTTTTNDDNDDDEIQVEEVKLQQEPEPQLDWSFPKLELDHHIQRSIDRNPKYNIIRVFAGMNWYGYMYRARESKHPHTSGDPPFVEPIAITAEQVQDMILGWKGQVDLKHDLASGDRFFLLRDGPDNNDIITIWYPSYRQLHRKLHNIRTLTDGIGVWECGQGLAQFDKLL